MVIYKKELKRNGRALYVELAQEERNEAVIAIERGERVIIDLSNAIEEVNA